MRIEENNKNKFILSDIHVFWIYCECSQSQSSAYAVLLNPFKICHRFIESDLTDLNLLITHLHSEHSEFAPADQWIEYISVMIQAAVEKTLKSWMNGKNPISDEGEGTFN